MIRKGLEVWVSIHSFSRSFVFCYNQLRNRKQSLNTNFLLFEVWQGRPESVSQLDWNGVVERHQLNWHFGAIVQTDIKKRQLMVIRCRDIWWVLHSTQRCTQKHRSRRSDLALTSYPILPVDSPAFTVKTWVPQSVRSPLVKSHHENAKQCCCLVFSVMSCRV